MKEEPQADPVCGPSILRVQLLGEFRVTVGDHPIADEIWRRRKVAGLLKLLALAPGHALPRDEILEALWPDRSPDAACNNLRYTAYALRAALQSVPGTPDGLVRRQGEQVVLTVGAAVVTDVAAFEAAAQSARQTADPEAYEAALAHYAGDLLPADRYEDWAAGRREALRDVYHGLLADLARLHEARREYPAAIATLERLVAIESCQEAAHAGLMRLYALAGQRGQALRQWARLEATLRHELDVAPDPASRRLRDDILAGRFPPSGAQAADDHGDPEPPRHNLPAPLTTFMGRTREIAATTELLASARLVTLAGMGGVGKTRLALEVASGLVAAYPDGVWLVALDALTDPSLVPTVVSQTLGVREAPGRSATASLAAALRERRLLLVFDNCEHLADACADLVASLLTACPDLRVLATSREPLRLPGEQVWRVPPFELPSAESPATAAALATSEAVQFFIARARCVRPGLALTPETAPAVVDICRRLDGLPLALELAAARLSILSPDQLATQLDDALGLIVGATRTVPPRLRALRATLDWSYALLDETERMLLRRLAVFVRGFTYDAAAAVGGGSGVRVLDGLAALVDKSLVLVEDDPHHGSRFRLLEPTRQYAWEQLAAAGETEELRQRHAAYFLALAEDSAPNLSSPWQVGFERLAGEEGNLRAVLDWALARGELELGLRLASTLSRLWDNTGKVDEGRRWLETAMARAGAAPDSVPPAVWARALKSLGTVATLAGDLRRADQCNRAALNLYRALEARDGVAWSLVGWGYQRVARGDYRLARPPVAESLTLFRELGDQDGIAWSLHVLGIIDTHLGEHRLAEAELREELALSREQGYPWHIGVALGCLGLLALVCGDAARAPALLRDALARLWALGDRLATIYMLEALAGALGALGFPEQSAQLLGTSETQREVLGLPMGSRAYRPLYERFLSIAREQLSVPAFSAAYEAGRLLPLGTAVQQALAGTQSLPTGPSTGIERLSPREQEVAALIVEGHTNAKIAAALGLSPRTAETHVRNILKKLGVASRAEIRDRLAPCPAHWRTVNE